MEYVNSKLTLAIENNLANIILLKTVRKGCKGPLIPLINGVLKNHKLFVFFIINVLIFQ